MELLKKQRIDDCCKFVPKNRSTRRFWLLWVAWMEKCCLFPEPMKLEDLLNSSCSLNEKKNALLEMWYITNNTIVAKLGFCDQSRMSYMFIIARFLCIQSIIVVSYQISCGWTATEAFLWSGIAPLCFFLYSPLCYLGHRTRVRKCKRS